MAATKCLNDDTFGPAVRGCRDDFDFTQKFEKILFSAVPASLFIVLALARMFQLADKPRLVLATPFQLMKVITITVYVAFQLSLLALVSVIGTGIAHGSSIAGAALVFAAGLFMIALSLLEHARSPRTSAILNIYLLMTLLFDVVQTRTLWLADSYQHQATFTRLFTASVAIKLVVLFLEAHSKAKWINWDEKDHSPEETSGIYSLSVFYWLRILFLRGFKRILSFEDLYGLDSAMSAEATTAKLMKNLDLDQIGNQKHSLLKALFKAFSWELLLPVCPHLTLIAFQYSQSFFLQSLLKFLERQDQEANKNNGYGLIAACALIFTGIAVSTSYVGYYTERAVSMTRACLCAAIYKKTTEITTATANDAASLTLMSTDVEAVENGFRVIHVMWSSLIQVGLGSWLLYTKIGVTFVVPIFIIALCSAALCWAMGFVGARQNRWMQQIEKRVGLTAGAISNMKCFKMLGISEHVAERIQGLREEEVRAGTKFRVVLLAAFALGQIPPSISPAVTFALTFRDLDASTLFVSLSFITFLTLPLSALFQSFPGCLAALASLHRIQEYLGQEPREDFRLGEAGQVLEDAHNFDDRNLGFGTSSEVLELQNLLRSGRFRAQDDSSRPEPAFRITNGSFGWDRGKNVLRDLNMVIPEGKVSIIVGPVASGKSTLCKVLLGEVPIASGTTETKYAGSSVGFSAQTPFLSDTTLMENIVGHSQFYQKKYDAIIQATMLGADVALLPSGHQTKIGSNGIILSGGQRQRVSLARALYLESKVVILDDVLSGLDSNTETEVFRRVLGPEGMIRQREGTAIICTHSVRHLRSADHIIVLGKDGIIVEQGTFDALVKNGKYVASLGVVSTTPNGQKEPSVEDAKEALNPVATTTQPDALVDESRQAGDWSAYLHYFRNIAKVSAITFMIFGLLAGASTNFATVWVSFWSEDAFNQSKAFYIGLYGMIGVMELLCIVSAATTGFTKVVSSSGLSLHRQAITTVVQAPLSLFTNTDTGTITNLFSQDMTLIDRELPLAFLNTYFNIAELIGNLFVVAVASPYLAISYPFLIALLYGIQVFYLRTSRQLRLLDLEAKSPLYNHFVDTLSGITTIRAFGWVDEEIARNRKFLNASQRPAYLLVMIQAWLQTNLTILVGAIAVCLTVLATQLRTSSGFTGASLLTLMSLTSTIASVMQSYTRLETSIGAINRLRTFSRMVKPEGGDDDDAPVPEDWPAKGDLSLSSVSATYRTGVRAEGEDCADATPETLALNNLSLSVQHGKKVAICGRTGSGKSSLMLLLLRLLDPLPSCRNIQVDGIPIHRVNRATLRQRFITVPQDSVFLPGKSSIKLNLDPLDTATDEECLSVLARVSLSGFVAESGGLQAEMYAENLSAGQQQLFGLGRAVLRRRMRQKMSGSTGGVLLLDEMNSKLDQDTDKITQEIIGTEFAGYAVVMVAHRLDMVMNLCDRVFVLDKGELVEEGEPRVLAAMKGSRFGELWKQHA